MKTEPLVESTPFVEIQDRVDYEKETTGLSATQNDPNHSTDDTGMQPERSSAHTISEVTQSAQKTRNHRLFGVVMSTLSQFKTDAVKSLSIVCTLPLSDYI